MSSRADGPRRIVVFALLAAALGCGKQGPPLPPLRNVPAPVKDLTVVQQGPQLLLSFTYPTVTPAGTALGGISAVEIWSVGRPAPGGKADLLDARAFGPVAKPVQKIAGADLTSATNGSRIDISLPLPPTTATAPAPAATPTPATPPAGSTGPTPLAAYFAVRTFGREGDRSDLSNIVSVVPKAPPPAPQQVTATARGDGILVEWTPVAGTVAGYNVYRRGSQERANAKPVHTAAPTEKSWLDTTAKLGQGYIYSVTALSQIQPPLESAIASEREVRYVDRFPPPAPTELVALAEAGRVRLVWRPSEAEDVAGYVVYRRVDETGKFERVTPQPVVSAEYVDTAVAAGKTYVYRVTAVDQTGNESGPGNEVRAEVP
ncbi:MAG: fibronectin type III domain-containing protein [Thermoanaerobaculia bacterium]